MNERIKQLAGKALDKAVPETWTTLTAYDLDKFTEKFAQLIVAECIGVVQKGGGMCGAISSNNLKQHFFGVEE